MSRAPAPDPPTPLGRYRRLSPRAGVLVSPIQLGAMSLGSKWPFVGTSAKDEAFQYLDAYYKAGGNFIDTANIYQFGESEEWLGEWMEMRGIRDQIVLATKYTGGWKVHESGVQQAAFNGNSLKSMKLSLESSLKKLRTTYVDILYVHWFEGTTSIEEMMDGLNNLVASGRVLYLGVSNTPAWIVAKCNQYARDHGKAQFVIYQGEWNVLKRDVEREILPMCAAEGMAFSSWNSLLMGKLRTDEEEEAREKSGISGRAGFTNTWKRNEVEKRMCQTLAKIGAEVGTNNIRAVALAYYLQKQPHIFPCIGGHKIEHLMANIESLKITLSKDHIKEIESVAPFDVGFPHIYRGDPHGPDNSMRANVCYDVEPPAAPIVLKPQ